jgi:hypothetical protein
MRRIALLLAAVGVLGAFAGNATAAPNWHTCAGDYDAWCFDPGNGEFCTLWLGYCEIGGPL